jgi:hypothetical protein
MKARICILSILILLGTGMAARAQKVSLNTDLVDWGYFGTINLEAGFSVSQHFSLMAGARYNPWEFKTRLDKDMYKKQITEYVGARWWPWYVYSGWWVGAKVQHSYFSETGMWRPALENKQAIGAGLSGGYTLMLRHNAMGEVPSEEDREYSTGSGYVSFPIANYIKEDAADIVIKWKSHKFMGSGHSLLQTEMRSYEVKWERSGFEQNPSKSSKPTMVMASYR